MQTVLKEFHNMKIGDLIKYRSWQLGDQSIDTIPEESRGWDSMGIVVGLCKSTFGNDNLEDAVEYIDANGNSIVARVLDIEVLS